MSLDPITAGLDFISKISDKIWPDPNQKAAGMLELEKLRQTGELARLASDSEIAKAQLAINAEEAKSERLFVAGWRPFIGWTCGVAFAYTLIIQPFMVFILVASGVVFNAAELPKIDGDLLGWALAGMLGLGGLKTIEKVKGA